MKLNAEDLRIWVAFAAQVLGQVAPKIYDERLRQRAVELASAQADAMMAEVQKRRA